MKKLSWKHVAAFAAMAALLAIGLSSCAGGGDASKEASPVRAGGEQVSRAMVVMQTGTSVLFVDTQTETPYYPTLPSGAVLDEQGQPMADTDLMVGNIVEVTGDGIMLESYPGQYPGIAKVQVVEQGKPSDAEPYADIVEAVAAGDEIDPNEVPAGNLDYTTDLAKVTTILNAYNCDYGIDAVKPGTPDAAQSAEGNAADSPVAAIAGTPFADDGTLLEGVADARIEKPVEATLSFRPAALSVEVSRVQMGKTSSGQPTVDRSKVASTAEPVTSTAVDGSNAGAVSFTIEPGYFYLITATFEAGTADYGFACLTPGSN